MRLLGSFGTARRLLAFASLLVALAVLAGAATVGRAATTNPISATFTVLNDVSATVPGQPSPGGNIGYKLVGSNTGSSVVNHFFFSESIGSKGKVVYLDYHGLNCTSSVDTVTCQLKQLGPGVQFDVTALFQTDTNATAGSDIVNHVVASFDSQTPNQKNSRTTDTFAPCDGSFDSSLTTSPCDVTRQYVGNTDGSLAESLALKGNKLNAGGTQTSSITMPPAFLNDFIFVGTRLENSSATPPCSNCQPFKTQVTMPAAPAFGPGGPFLKASTAAPYTLTITVPVSPNFKPFGVWHTNDNGLCSTDPNANCYLPACAIVDGNPVPTTDSPGLCTAGITTQKKGNTVFVTYTVLGDNNGSNYGG
jgi:hypothetical protein